MAKHDIKTPYPREEASEYAESLGFTFHLAAGALQIDQQTAMCHLWNVHVGWWSDLDHFIATGEAIPLYRNFGELVALQHSELSEALEGFRTGAMSDKIPEFTAVEEELADALIRIFDTAGAMKLRLGEAYKAKFQYNMTRRDHLLEERAKTGGKKI